MALFEGKRPRAFEELAVVYYIKDIIEWYIKAYNNSGRVFALLPVVPGIYDIMKKYIPERSTPAQLLPLINTHGVVLYNNCWIYPMKDEPNKPTFSSLRYTPRDLT